MVTRVDKRGERTKLASTCTGHWWVVPVPGCQHVYRLEDIVASKQKEVQIVRVILYADELMAVTEKRPGVFTTLNSQGGLQTEAIQATVVSADSETGRVVQVTWAGIENSR